MPRAARRQCGVVRVGGSVGARHRFAVGRSRELHVATTPVLPCPHRTPRARAYHGHGVTTCLFHPTTPPRHHHATTPSPPGAPR